MTEASFQSDSGSLDSDLSDFELSELTKALRNEPEIAAQWLISARELRKSLSSRVAGSLEVDHDVALKPALPSESEHTSPLHRDSGRQTGWQRVYRAGVAIVALAVLILVAYPLSVRLRDRSGVFTFPKKTHSEAQTVYLRGNEIEIVTGDSYPWNFKPSEPAESVAVYQVDNVTVDRLPSKLNKEEDYFEGEFQSEATSGFVYLIAIPDHEQCNVLADKTHNWLRGSSGNSLPLARQILSMNDDEFAPERAAKLVADILRKQCGVAPSGITVVRIQGPS